MAMRGCLLQTRDSVDRLAKRTDHGHVRFRPACLLVAGSLLALTLAAPAEAKRRYLRFEVSVKGQQTANWTGTRDAGGCGTIHRSGSQTIAFESRRPGRLSLRRFPKTNPRTGTRRGFTYFGIDAVPTNWTFTRTFQESWPPACPPPSDEEPVVAAQANDCGTQGPFPVPVSVAWRGGFVEFRGVLDPEAPRKPSYRTCEYEAFHTADLIDSKGRLSQRRLTSRRRRTMRVRVSARLKEPGEGEGSQTTTLAAIVTLKRLR
jgi:hypothetical protein